MCYICCVVIIHLFVYLSSLCLCLCKAMVGGEHSILAKLLVYNCQHIDYNHWFISFVTVIASMWYTSLAC